VNNLKELDISNTDIDQGIEHLPKKIKEISYSTEERKGCKLKEIVEVLEL